MSILNAYYNALLYTLFIAFLYIISPYALISELAEGNFYFAKSTTKKKSDLLKFK